MHSNGTLPLDMPLDVPLDMPLGVVIALELVHTVVAEFDVIMKSVSVANCDCNGNRKNGSHANM